MKAIRAGALRWLEAAAILTSGLAAYAPALRGGWIWDDAAEITRNSALRQGHAFGRIWISPAGSDYFPLKSTVQWLEWRIWGSNPFGYHCVNLALHLLSALLVWRLLGRLLARAGRDFSAEAVGLASWLGAVLFALHPMAVESVAWIAELKNALSLPPLLLAFLAWDRWDRLGGRTYWSSLGWFLAALLCKTSVVMFPAILLVHAWWRRRRIGKRDLVATLPFFAGSLTLGLVTLWFQKHRAIVGADLGLAGFLTRLARARIASGFYLSKFVLPARLSPIYPRWTIFHPEPAQFLPWAALAAMSIWLLVRRGNRGALFGLGCYFAALFPVLGFFPMAYMRISWAADHFAYLALVPLVGICAVGAARACDRWPNRRRWVAGAGIAVCFLFGFLTFRQCRIYRDDETFWRYALRENPGAWLAHDDLGILLAAQGRLPEAIGHFRQGIALNPKDAEGARANLANALAQSGKFEEAIGPYEEALRLRPGDSSLKAGLAYVHYQLGNGLGNGGRLDAAARQYEAALRLRPDYAEARANLGLALAGMHRDEDAVAQLREALREKPDYADAHSYLGFALAGLGRDAEAIAEYRAALRLGADTSDLHYNLGLALRAAGRTSEAEAEFARAARLPR